MMRSRTPHRPHPARSRRGATLVECALVYPLAMLLMSGLLVLGVGVFRHQQIALLAREAARWASVRGPAYQAENGQAAPTADDVKSQALAPLLGGLSPGALQCTLSSTPSTVTVTLRYNWSPGGGFRAVTLQSTASAPITY